MPSSGGRPLLGAHLPPPQPFLHAGKAADEEPEWEALETESELHDRVAREQVASAHAQAQVRLQMRKRQDGHATYTSRSRPRFAVVPVQDGDLVACVAQRQEQRLKRKREQEQAHAPKGRRRLIEIRLEAKSEAQGQATEGHHAQVETTSSSAAPMEEDDALGKENETADPVAANPEQARDKGHDDDNDDRSNATDITDNALEKQVYQNNLNGASNEVASSPAQTADNTTQEGKSVASNAEKENEKGTKRNVADAANGARADGHQQARRNGYGAGYGAGMGIEPPLGFAGRATLRLPPPRPYPPAGKLGADLEAWSAREIVPPGVSGLNGHSGNTGRSAGSQADGGTDPSAASKGLSKKAAAAAAAAAAAQQQPFVPASVPADYAETEAYKLYPHVTMSDLALAFARIHRNAIYGAGVALTGGGMR